MSLILLTRPQAQAERFSALLTACGHTSIISPLLEIVPLPWHLERLPAGVVITSSNALPALAATPALHGLPCFVVGTETARLARALGCTQVIHAPNVAALLPLLADAARPLLYLRGQEISHEIQGVDAAVVYEARPVAALSPEAQEAFRAGRIAVATFFSARTGRLFASLAEAAEILPSLQAVEAVAISSPVAAALAGLSWRAVTVSATPDAEGMAVAIDKRLARR